MRASKSGSKSSRAMVKDIDALLVDLKRFRGGIADTSTLIYLERLGLLDLAARCFSLRVIPQVVAEFGMRPAGTIPLTAVPSGPADLVICQEASRLGLPVLSEDRHVLRAARAGQLPYYNTLMMVLALCVQGELAPAAFADIRRELLVFARYAPWVVAVGDALFEALCHAPTREV